MGDQTAGDAPVIVALPAALDMASVEADRLLPVYSSVEEASDLGAAARDPLSSRLLLARRTTCP
jgi:hypothetical protein